MAIVSIYEAKQGMVLQKEVFDLNTGRIILSSGTKLTERNIEQLKELKISFIEIESAQNTEKAEEISLEMEDFMTKEEKITFYAHRLCDDLESLFIMIRNGKKIVVGEISKSLDRIVDILLQGDDIVKKIKIANLSDVDYTIRHSVHVCFYATMIGKWLNYDRIRIKQLAFSGLLHDIGKSKIPEYILDKPNKLTEKEYEIVKKHVVYGYNVLKETVGIGQAIAYGALQHHERENGTGYPLG